MPWLGAAVLGLVGLLMLLVMAGCTSTRRPGAGGHGAMGDVPTDPQRAARLALHSADLIESDPAAAESQLLEALKCDPYCGPAHNNLGVLYLDQGKFYEAASAFESARKLMPGQPDPRMNLGYTLERAGRVDDALQTYGTALEVYPDHVPTLQALCRLQLRCRRTDAHTRDRLEEIALRGETPEWRTWAAEQLLKLRESA